MIILNLKIMCVLSVTVGMFMHTVIMKLKLFFEQSLLVQLQSDPHDVLEIQIIVLVQLKANF